MANHMEEVAKILGIELGEDFEIKGCNGTYYLVADGLYQAQSGFKCEKTLHDLLVGVCTIKHKPWKPSTCNIYHYVGDDGMVHHIAWANILSDKLRYKLGNCYRTREEAESNRDKWIAFYASDEVLEV